MTERAFVEKMNKIGFAAVTVRERETYGVSELEAEPLFPRDLIALMRELIPVDVQERIGVRIVVTGTKPGGAAMSARGSAS